MLIMNHHDTESTSHRGLLNGLVNVATRSWRNGLQPNSQNLNALVFPTVATAANTSLNSRSSNTDGVAMAEEQHRRLQQQQNQDHRLNLLWYGGDDLHQQQQPAPSLFELQNRNQSTDDWEKQPLRQQRWKSQYKSRRRQYKKKRPKLPMVPIVWASMLHVIYTATMATVYYLYGATFGSGWIWLRGISSSSDGISWWLRHISPTWYYMFQAFCAASIGCFQYWGYQQCQQQRQQRWFCYILLILFSTALFPSVPLAEVFGDNSRITSMMELKNSTFKLQQQSSDFNVRNFDENRLSLYEGLWQVVFFIFVAYCLVFPINVNEHLDKGNDENINEHHNENQKNININVEGDHHVTIAILSFTFVSSFGHIALNTYIAYYWYYQKHLNQDVNLMPSMAAIRQQVIANVIVLVCINLIGWLLHQHIVRDRAEIGGYQSCVKPNNKNKQLRFTLNRQVEKLNKLLRSLLPRRVFFEMRYDIVTDAARSCDTIYGSTTNDCPPSLIHLLQPQIELEYLQTPRLPRMYLKEYENVSVVFANVTKFWDNVSTVLSHSESGTQMSQQFITLIDRLLIDLFRGLARRNNCLDIRLLGHRIYFVAGLPVEETYSYDDDDCKNIKMVLDDNGHANNAIQLGLDLVKAINNVVHDISRRRSGHKINLNIRVGIHSGQVACGVIGFARNTRHYSSIENRWQYDVWGRDVDIASCIESSGRSGSVQVSQATVDQIIKNRTADTHINNSPPSNSLDSNDRKDNYTFERCPKDRRDHFLCQNQIDTYFVVPSEKSLNSSKISMDLQEHNKDTNYYSEDIESLILQSVEHQLQLINLAPDIEIASGQILSTNSKTADVDVSTASLINTASVTNKMIMNRHRRSRYEQELLPTGVTKLNTSTAISSVMKHQWEDDVFGVYDNDNIKQFRGKSDDDDLFRLAKSQLLLLCVVIALFIVNVTTMPWTLLLGITFIIPFILIAGELIYVMALLIGWIPRPKFRSNIYAATIITEDDEYYNHYDSDNYSDSSSSSDNNSSCLRHLLVCHFPNNCLLWTWILKPFRWIINTMMPNRNSLENNNGHRQRSPKWYHACYCYGNHSWFTWCSNDNRASSWMSSDDSDIECGLGFRNENAVIAATAAVPQSQLQNQLQHSQSININRNHSISRQRQRHRRKKLKYEDQERRTKFFWISACGEMLVLLLVCVLALLNAFTCEPVTTATNTVYYSQHIHNMINNSSDGFNTTHQNPRNPLICLWPQYAVITCCLACVSVAIAFPIYYGALPTLRMKVVTLLVMICVFAVAFIHFTHRHVFIAASVSSMPSSCCSEGNNIIDNQTTNNTNSSNNHQNLIHTATHQDHYEEDQRMLRLQDQVTQQQLAANLNTATATVYVIVFIAAIITYSVYGHCLQKQRAHLRIKTDRDMRRLEVLQTAHRKTLRTIVPDHVADSLRKFYNDNVNEANKKHGETRNDLPGTINSRIFPCDHLSQGHIPANTSPPLYHCSYRAVVVVFATIVQQDQQSTSTSTHSHYNKYCHRHFTFINDIFSEFDQLLDNQKFQGLVEKIKMVGTDTYMIAIGLQQQHEPEHLLNMLQEKMTERNIEQYGKPNFHSFNGSRVMDNNITNGYELYDVISANYIVFALDFIRDMRRVLNRAISPNGNLYSQPTQLTLRVGVNVGPVVAGLIGCNDGIWKRPQFDIWGNTVNVAKHMDITGVPGCTQVTNYVVEVMRSLKEPDYEFEIRTKVSNVNKRTTYFLRDTFNGRENYFLTHQQQCFQDNVIHRKPQRILKQHKHLIPKQSSLITHLTIPQLFDYDQSLPVSHNMVPVVAVHPQHPYYNAMVQQDLRNKCLESQKTTSSSPPPPPPRSPPPVNIRRTQHSNYPLLQHQHSGEQYSDQRQRSRGTHSSQDNQNNQQQKRRTPDTAIKATYARPLQQQNNDRLTSQPSMGPVPRGLVLMFGDDSQHVIPPTANVKPTGASSNDRVPTVAIDTNHERQQQLRRPTVLALVNTTADVTSVGRKNFDADRPLPAPPRSSDTVAGRQRHHHDPRRRRRRQQHSNSNFVGSVDDQELRPLRLDSDDQRPAAWSFRSPISAGSLVSVPSSPPPPSSLSSSSESTDAGDTTTSHNNYNTTTGSSSSSSSSSSSLEDSYGRGPRRDTEDYDTNPASSAAVSPIHNRYRQQQQQQRILLRQWSPATTTTATANSSPVRRSTSFRSPLSPSGGVGDHTAASSSSLRSPPVAGPTVSGTSGCSISGTQSLNRRRVRSGNNTAATGGGSSGRRRRRRQQQNNATVPGRSSPSGGVIVNVVGVATNTTITETPPSSPWKKQQQRRQVTSKDQGTEIAGTGPDFADEIRRILLLDHHRGNVRQQQLFKDGEEDINKIYPDEKERVVDVAVKQPLEQNQHRNVVVASKNQKSNIESSDRQNENNIDPATIISENISSTSSFEEREREITEQVKRQQAEVRRILQEHKNNVVAVVKEVAAVTSESVLHGRRPRVPDTTLESSEWSDDESVEPPSSSLLDHDRHKLHNVYTDNIGDYEANLLTVNTEYTTCGDGDGYTTGGDGDGYTTTGYTTDDAAVIDCMDMEMEYNQAVDLPVASLARQLDDNLSTMNDTGLTDAEAALSDVNSMINYNDCNDNDHYRSRRQSSLSSYIGRYASDSFCDDDDDDDDNESNDNNELFFQERYHMEDEEQNLCNEDNDNSSRYNACRLLQQQQLLQPQELLSLTSDDLFTDNINKRLYSQQLQQPKTQLTEIKDTTQNILISTAEAATNTNMETNTISITNNIISDTSIPNITTNTISNTGLDDTMTTITNDDLDIS